MQTGQSFPKSYISEIDALRALAVILVLLFHGFPNIVPGGFIGVDVFFVISGFVIARSYLFDLQERRKSLIDFYLARFRRLAPAYAMVIFLTSVAAIFIMLPDKLEAYGNSLVAQPFYLQNFVFWSEGDYFSGALNKPLLHTWSLAVEEQFYLAWGGATLFLRKHAKILIASVIALMLFSLAAGFVLESRSPKTVFYHLPFRIWEFLFGVVAYLAIRKGWAVAKFLANTGLWLIPLCLILIIASALYFHEGAAFPGPQSLIACTITSIALMVFDGTAEHRRLSWLSAPAITYVGKISYGLYLWHWPPLALWYMSEGQPADTITALCLLVTAFLGAALSYRYVEEPIRRGRLKASGLLAFVGTSSAAMLAVGLVIISTNGLLSRYPTDVRTYLAAPNEKGAWRCGKIFSLMHPAELICPLQSSESSGSQPVLIIGDSHADVLKEMLALAASNNNRRAYLTVRNCDLGRFGDLSFCSDEVLYRIISKSKELGIRNIVAISYWEDQYIEESKLVEELTTFVEAGFTVDLMRRVPSSESYDPRDRAVDRLSGGSLDRTGMSLDEYQRTNEKIDRTLIAAASRFPEGTVSILSPSEYLCDAEVCRYEENGVPFYLDTNHLTFTGARQIQPMFEKAFRLPQSSEIGASRE